MKLPIWRLQFEGSNSENSVTGATFTLDAIGLDHNQVHFRIMLGTNTGMAFDEFADKVANEVLNEIE